MINVWEKKSFGFSFLRLNSALTHLSTVPVNGCTAVNQHKVKIIAWRRFLTIIIHFLQSYKIWRPRPFFRPSDLLFICGLPCIGRLRFCVTEETVCPTCTAHDAHCAAIVSAMPRCSDDTQHVSIIKHTLSLCLYHTDSTASFRYEHQSWLGGMKLRGWMLCVSYCCPILTKREFLRQISWERVELLHAVSRGSRIAPCRRADIWMDIRTGMTKLVVPFRMLIRQK